jgi:hypothetical protein
LAYFGLFWPIADQKNKLVSTESTWSETRKKANPTSHFESCKENEHFEVWPILPILPILLCFPILASPKPKNKVGLK